MKNRLKKTLSILVAFILTFVMSFVAPQKIDAASTPTGYVTVSIEKFTLGLGYIIEPVRVPIYKGDTGAKVISRLMDKKLGKDSYEYTGTIDDQSGKVGQSFYLASIRDKETRNAKVPKYIEKSVLDAGNTIGERDREDWLGEFDYTFMSGWMYAVNNWFPNYGAGNYKLKDGDVMRWQFTVWGYGADLGSSFMSEESQTKPLINAANKDKLTEVVAKINSSDSKATLLKDKEIKNTYNKSYTILQNMESTQSEVDTLATKLNKLISNVSNKKSFVATSADKEYTGKSIKPSLTVKDGNKILKDKIDYTFSYKKDNKNIGTYKITVTGKGNYKGVEKTVSYNVKPRQVKNLKATTTTKAIKLTWDKLSEVDGYKVCRYNTKTKTYDVIKTINKNKTVSYTDEVKKDATTYSYKIRGYKTVNKKNYYGSYSRDKKVTTNPLAPSIKLTTGGKKVKITWKKISKVNGYEVYSSTSKSGKYKIIKVINNDSTLSYTNSKLTKNKVYYYKVRAYKIVDGKKIYSDYSSIKNIKVK